MQSNISRTKCISQIRRIYFIEKRHPVDVFFLGSSSWTRTTSVCNINSISPSSGLFHCVAAPPPRSLFRPLDAVAARSPASASGSQARWFGSIKKSKTKGTLLRTFHFGSSSWTRTNDPAVNSRMLYRLSYRGIYLIMLLLYYTTKFIIPFFYKLSTLFLNFFQP